MRAIRGSADIYHCISRCRSRFSSTVVLTVRRFLATGKRWGYVTFEEANNVLPESEVSSEEIEALIAAIDELGFELRES